METQNVDRVQRYVPLVCWLIVCMAALLICLKIISYGYVPVGDARRHVAKAFTDRPYSDLVVMRSFYKIDHSPGYEWVLRAAQRLTGWRPDGLAAFSTAMSLGFVLVAPLVWFRRPEAWCAAVLLQLIAIPDLIMRWTQARPFVLSEGVLMCLLLSWRHAGVKTDGKEEPVAMRKIIFATAAYAFIAWMHGVWYLWVLLLPAFALAGRWRTAAWMTVCWLVGSFLGSLLTGHPIDFMMQQVLHGMAVGGEKVPPNLLVGELQPSAGEFTSLTALAAVYLWSRSLKVEGEPLVAQPAFWMLAIGWTLGLFMDRFWADWGLPAAVVWMALRFQDVIERLWSPGALMRLMACGCIALPLYLQSSSDQQQRFSKTLREARLDASDPDLKGWLPDPGGIFYSAQMEFFYNTFYTNPKADWKYLTGFEPALMPEDDLKILRTIQAADYLPSAYAPWVAKMKPADRIEIEDYSDTPPNLPELEWKRAVGYIWIGRLPKHEGVAPKK